jgi:DNA-binding transcriptional ArsR family regulator
MSLDQQRIDRVAEIMRVIAHPIRMEVMLFLLKQGPSIVSSIQAELQIEQSLLSHHLIKMKDRGVLYSDRKGKTMFYGLVDPSLVDVITPFLKLEILSQT